MSHSHAIHGVAASSRLSLPRTRLLASAVALVLLSGLTNAQTVPSADDPPAQDQPAKKKTNSTRPTTRSRCNRSPSSAVVRTWSAKPFLPLKE